VVGIVEEASSSSDASKSGEGDLEGGARRLIGPVEGAREPCPRFLFVVEIFTLYRPFGGKLKSSHASSRSEAMAPARLARLAYSCVL